MDPSMDVHFKERRVYEIAMANDGVFLTHRWHADDEPSEDERACERLVRGGYAYWIPRGSDFSPGIRLTGKPL